MNPAGRPVRFDPEPRKLVAVTIPATILGDPAILSPENVVAVIIPAPIPASIPVLLTVNLLVLPYTN